MSKAPTADVVESHLVNEGVTMCPKCGQHPAQYPHKCPYNDAVNGNEKELCTCCEECTYDCALQI